MPQKTVYVELVAKTEKLQNGLKKADRKVNTLTKSFKRLGVALIATFGARELFRGFQQTLKQTDALIRTAKGIGFTVDEYQRLVFALDQVGISAGSAKIAIGDFQKRVAKAAAGVSPQFAKAFRQAGLDPVALSKLGPAAAFDIALKQLATLRNDPTIAGLTGNVFEEQSGKDILQALRQWEEFTAARESFGTKVGKLNQREINQIQKLNAETKLLTAQWENMRIKLVAEVAPDMIDAIQSISDSGALKNITDSVVTVINKFSELIDNIKWVASLLDDLPIPGFLKDAARGTSGTDILKFTPLGAVADAPNALSRARKFFSPNETPLAAGGFGGNQTTTNVTIRAARGSNEITDAEARRIKKAFDQVTRQAAQ